MVVTKIKLNSGYIYKVVWKDSCMRDIVPISNETLMRLRAFLA